MQNQLHITKLTKLFSSDTPLELQHKLIHQLAEADSINMRFLAIIHDSILKREPSQQPKCNEMVG